MGLIAWHRGARASAARALTRTIGTTVLLACVVAAPSVGAEIEGATLEVDLTTADRASAVLVLSLPGGLEQLELVWLELGDTAVELVDARLLPPGAVAMPVAPVTSARVGPRSGFDLVVALPGGPAASLQLSYLASVPAQGPVTVPIPAPHLLLAPGSELEVDVRLPPDRAIASPFPAGLREAARDSAGALYHAELPVVPAMLRFRLVPAGRWWSVSLLLDLAVAAIVLSLVAVGWRRFAGTR